MKELKCPSCGAGGRVPTYKINVRLICKKCLKPFHVTASGHTIPGDPPVAKDAPKGTRPGESHGYETGVALEEMASRLSRFNFKLPQISPITLAIIAGLVLLLGGGYWLLSRQSLEARATFIANSMIKGEMKSVIDVCVPGTETEAIMWYGDVYKKYMTLKLALGGQEAVVHVQPQGDTRGGSALVVAHFSREGTPVESSAFADALQPVPSLANNNQTMQVPIFLAKAPWGDWLLDGKRTAAGSTPGR